MLCLSVDFLSVILFNICTPWIYRLVSLTKFSKFSAISPSYIFSVPVSCFFSFRTTVKMYVSSCFPTNLETVFNLFFSQFSLCCLDCINSLNMASSLLILSSVIPTIELLKWVFHSIIIFFYSIITIWFFFITSNCGWYFLFLKFVSREFVIDCWSIFTIASLKKIIFSGHSNIWFISVLVSLSAF